MGDDSLQRGEEIGQIRETKQMIFGKRLNRAQNCVEWGETPPIRPYVQASICPPDQPLDPSGWPSDPYGWPQDLSGGPKKPYGWPQDALADPQTPLASPQGPPSWPSNPWPALRLRGWPSDPSWLALRPPMPSPQTLWAGPYTQLAGLQTL